MNRLVSCLLVSICASFVTLACEPAPQPTTGGAAGEGDPTAAASQFDVQVDRERRLVFLPGEGWLTVEEFREIYLNEPQRLEGTIDFDGLAALGLVGGPGG
jgi:hypothetical protein